MTVSLVALYRCDICKKVEAWGPTWLAVTMVISSRLFWEHEFHVCSRDCDHKLEALTKPERKQLALTAAKSEKV